MAHFYAFDQNIRDFAEEFAESDAGDRVMLLLTLLSMVFIVLMLIVVFILLMLLRFAKLLLVPWEVTL